VFTRSSKRPTLARVFWIHLLEVCWTFAGSCKHPIRQSTITAWAQTPLNFDFLYSCWTTCCENHKATLISVSLALD